MAKKMKGLSEELNDRPDMQAKIAEFCSQVETPLMRHFEAANQELRAHTSSEERQIKIMKGMANVLVDLGEGEALYRLYVNSLHLHIEDLSHTTFLKASSRPQ